MARGDKLGTEGVDRYRRLSNRLRSSFRGGLGHANLENVGKNLDRARPHMQIGTADLKCVRNSV